MKYKILIVGLGNIGKRYFQGICKITDCKIDVLVIDKDIKKLNRFILENKTYSSKNVSLKRLSSSNKKIDLIIISTTAKNRNEVIKHYNNKYKISKWIIEKVLEQNSTRVLNIYKILTNKKAFINIPRRLMTRFIKLKKNINKKSNLVFKISGGDWGLASNAIHFLDLVFWITKTTPYRIEGIGKGLKWKKSRRRKSFLEANGGMKIYFKKNNILTLSSSKTSKPLKIEIFHKNNKWVLYEVKLVKKDKKEFFVYCNSEVKKNENIIFRDKLVLQSNLSKNLVRDLLKNDRCRLPRLKDQVMLHQVMLEYFSSTITTKHKLINIT